MKTAVKNATAVQGTAAKNNQTANRVENRPSLTQKEAKEDENAKDQTSAQTPQVEANKTAEVKTSSPATVDNQPANIAPYTTGQGLDEARKAEPVKAEPVKADEVKAEPKKFALNFLLTVRSIRFTSLLEAESGPQSSNPPIRVNYINVTCTQSRSAGYRNSCRNRTFCYDA